MGESSHAQANSSLPPEAGQRLLEQVFAIWITPEIERRRAAGVIGDDWPFRAAQIVFNVGGQNEVRLNEQVKAVLQLKPTRPVAQGEPIRSTDVSEIVGVKLTSPDANAGHVSIFLLQEKFYVFCDFRYNGQRVRETLAAADEFLETAAESLAAGRLRPALADLSVATERLAKGFLLLLPDEKALTSTSHDYVKSTFNLYSNLGNASGEYAALLNNLRGCYADVRYSTDAPKYGPQQVGSMLATARAMRGDLGKRVPPEAASAY